MKICRPRILLLAALCAVVSGCGSGGTTESPASGTNIPVGGATPTPTPVASASPTSSAARTATITNSGSTNTLPYTQTITLNADGTVSPATVPPSLALQLFSDLDAANPVSALPQEFCAKSASFGTSTYIQYKGSTSPDLQCQSNSTLGTALNQDVSAIVQALSLGGPRLPVTQ